MGTSQQLKNVVLNISKTDIIIQEMLGVVAGIKPCFIKNLNEKESKLIIDKFPELSIEQVERISMENCCEILYGISKKRRMAKLVINSFLAERDMTKTGKLLGYPECCVRNHFYFVKHNMQHQHPKVVYQSHKKSKKHSFLTNNLFNFTSRLHSKEDFRKQKRYFSLNKNFSIPIYYLQFISHIPCSYDCQESIKIGRKIHSLLKEYAPKIEKVVTYTLSKPVLFFDLFEWVIFEGHVKENTLFYKEVMHPISLINSSLLNKIKKGNKIFVNNNKIKIFKDSSLIYSYLKKDKTDGFILDFK